MKRLIILSAFVICSGVAMDTYNWINAPVSVEENHCSVEDLVDDMDAFNKAISKMGPYYQYFVDTNGNLFINRGDGKWLKLKYKKGETK